MSLRRLIYEGYALRLRGVTTVVTDAKNDPKKK